MADQTFDGQTLRVLTVLDHFSRVSPAIQMVPMAGTAFA